MHTTNYVNTLIEVSEDCPATTGTVPPKPGTVAALQYELLSSAPYRYTSDELLVAVAALRQGRAEADWPEVMAELFSKPQACLRSSPLVKTYGFGVHHDAESRVALVPRDSVDYRRMQADEAIAKTRGMRSKRA
jgi:hypothetical protein